MNKISYPLLAIEIDRLYNQISKDSSDSKIEAQLQLIENFIVSCGYTVEEYNSEYINQCCVGFESDAEKNSKMN